MSPIKAMVFIGVTLATVLFLWITQTTAQQPLSNHDLKQQLTNLSSFSTETTAILNLYADDQLSFVYVKNQTEQIDKNVSDFYSLLESKPLEDNQQNDITALEDLVFQFSMQLKRIGSSEGDTATLAEVRQRIQRLHDQFAEAEEQYE
jgi:hypothetical protein